MVFHKSCLLLLLLIHVILFGKVGLATGQAATCACDLTENGCDPNCCCDNDCTAADRSSFTFCKNVDLNQDDRVCVSNQIIEFANAKYRTSATGSGLFCIHTDNYAARNFYTTVQTATTVSRFDELLKTYGKTSFVPSPLPTRSYVSSSIYKYGDPVILLFESNVQGYLAFPKSNVGNSECDDENPAGFMKNEDSACSRYIRDLASQCISDSSFNALSYYTQFKFLPGPSFLAERVLYIQENVTITTSIIQPTPVATNAGISVNRTASSVFPSPSPVANSTGTTTKATTRTIYTLVSYNDPLLVSASLQQPIVCQTTSGVQGNCSFVAPSKPSYNFTSNVCQNVLLKASYIVFYDTNSTALNVSSVSVNLVMGDIPSTMTSFKQEFSIRFQKVGSQSTFSRSGNPGYVHGRPILAGTLQTNTQQKKEAIILNKDPNKWLTVIKSSSDACGVTSQRMSVKFGINIRTGCFISIKRVMTNQECSLLQSNIYNSLLGSFPTHVAMYGNSAVTNTADWVPIINSQPQTPPSSVNGECTNMILGVHFEILHGSTGYLGNPQSRVIGFRVKYDSPKTISFLCIGPYCQPGSSNLQTQQIEVSQSVSFIDVSTSPEAQMKPKPNFEGKAPYDFFYPFV
ncbi:tectonic-3-like [Rhopilema esculentum]|uniref:tectonic-3-like n=1 Tax=Rhopilema esculentum TaxID=499914 RepID=UPI0031CF640E|eukprot:gene12931-3688_t